MNIKVKVEPFKWQMGGESDDKWNASLNAAIRRAFEENLPEHFNVEFDVDAAVSDAIPHAIKQFFEEFLLISPCKSQTPNDMGIWLNGLEGYVDVKFDLGEMLLNEANSCENREELLDGYATWLEDVAKKIRNAAPPTQD